MSLTLGANGAAPGIGLANESEPSEGPGLTPQAVHLRGVRASATFQFEHHHAQAPKLLLAIRVSALLDRERSTLSVQLDDMMIQSERLRRLPEDGIWRVPLGEAARGAHRLQIRARLVVAEDPCLASYEDEAWIQLLPSSRLSPASETRAPPETISALPSAWRGQEVEILPPVDESPESRVAVLEALHLLTRWGARGHRRFSDGARWILATSEELPTDLPTLSLQELLLASPSDIRALARRDGDSLWLVGRTIADLHRGILQLGDDSLRRLCAPEGPCRLGVSARPPEAPSSENSSLTWRLAEGGYAWGWLAEGFGSHTLRFVWSRPLAMQLQGEPELHLRVRLAERGASTGRRTMVRVDIGERPMGSWDLSEVGGEQVLKMKIPQASWNDDAWDFRVRVWIRPDESAPCTWQDASAAWLTVGPDSGLRVPHQRAERIESIRAFFEASVDARPSLGGSLSGSWSQLFHVAELLAPFAQRTPMSRWRWVEDGGSAGIRLVSLGTTGEGDDSTVPFVPLSATEQWLQDRIGVLGAPLLGSGLRALLALDPERPQPQLTVGLPAPRSAAAGYDEHEGVDGTVESRAAAEVDYRAFSAPIAVHGELGWVLLGEEPQAIAPPASTATRTPSEEEQALSLANRVWIALLALLLAIAFLYWARAPLRRSEAGQ